MTTTDPTPNGDTLPPARSAPSPESDAAKARKPILNRYADGGLIVVQAAANLTDEQAQARPGPGTWSLAELFAHLADCDLVHTDRIKRIIAEDHPTLLGFNESDWLDRLESGRMPVAESVALLAANRAYMARLLRTLDDAAFFRTGLHTEYGRQTLGQIVVRGIHHVDHHLRFAYEKRARLGTAIYPRYATNPGF